MHISSSLLIPLVSGIYLLSIHLILRVCQFEQAHKIIGLFSNIIAD